MIKFKELVISDRIMTIVEREIGKLESGMRDTDFMKLEKLAKVYQILMANHRENIKHGVFGKLDTKELQDAVDGGDSSSDADDTEEDEL